MSRAAPGLPAPRSLRWRLVAGIVLPIALFVAFDAASTYRSALASINTAYDRSLLASARSIGELLQPAGGRLRVEVPYAALEVFDAGNEGRIYYRINGFDGEFLSGYEDLPAYTRALPRRSDYAALVDFYDGEYRGERVRMAALYQPVAGAQVRGVALIQVAETLGIRERHTRRLLVEMLLRRAAMLGVVLLVVTVVVAHALRPLEGLRSALSARNERDLSPVATPGLPAELQPVEAAVNELMQRLGHLIGHQRQFVRDASHQLRTPLAVLKTQAQNGLSGHAPPRETLERMHDTIERAVRLANQMLALAKLEQVHHQDEPQPLDLAGLTREVALDLAPLIADKGIDFELVADTPVRVLGHDWMLREVTRNLLHNAVRETPAGAPLTLAVDVLPQGAGSAPLARLLVRDSGPGLAPAQRERLFEPFHTGHPSSGTGLGLAICREACERLGARLELLDRLDDGGRVAGLDAVVTMPLVDETTGTEGGTMR
ncbi:sensor histidine kinase [Caldimonas tepidiphila]|uniref:sensor histidine kinase n=1 Tax=Caldimonas tepidiphila TaxID=2315841 RepID=UPI001F0B77B0|nr:sensor histidine kinase [Caldimonas tepidiphila]